MNFMPFGQLKSFLKILIEVQYYGTPLLPSRVQHILDKNSVPRSRIVHQHMGHSAYQLAVLNNRASAHG